MLRFEFENICGWLLFLAASMSAVVANGQYYGPDPNTAYSGSDARQPINQLPPIVSPNRAQAGSMMLQPVRDLNLPPIVGSGNQVNGPANSNPTQIQPPAARSRQYSQPGVPRYSGQNLAVPFENSGINTRTAPAVPASFRQGGEAPMLPQIIEPGNMTAPGSFPMQDFSNSLSPGDLPSIPDIEIDMPATSAPATRMESGPINAPGTTDYFQQPQASFDGNAGCSSCGPNGCYDLANVQNQFGCCGSVVSAGYYMFLEGMVWSRSDGDVQLSNFFGLNSFEVDGGIRLTLGYRQNATRGREFTYFGTGELNESRTVTRLTGGLGSRFTPTDGLGFGQTNAFFNAVTQTQSKTSQLQSLAYNRVNWSWDLLKTYIGARYIYFDDTYSYISSNGTTNGLFTMDSVNNLFGLNAGFELFYDVGYRTSVSFDSKFGGYVNAANVDTNLFNGGVQQLSQDVDDSSFASTVELELMTHVKLGSQSRLRLGYDLLLMWGAFTVENNIPRDEFQRGIQVSTPLLTPTTGATLNTSNEAVFLNGLVFGFEVFR